MLKFQLLQVQDLKEAALIERRRQLEEDRKKRIFNARNRMIGVDIDGLNQQIEEKQKRLQNEKVLEEMYIQKQIQDSVTAMELEKKEKEERKRILHEINEFRKHFQKKEDTREFDLNDPKYLAKTLPMRLNDDDPRCGISSAQKFEGEDLASDARKKIQLEQTKAWLEQQMIERKAAESDFKLAEQAYQEAVVARDERAKELDRMEKECRRQMLLAIRTFNKSLMDKQIATKEIKDRQELEDNFAEMYNAVTGDFLTENPNSSQGNFGPDRPIAYMFKGMSPEQRDAIRRDQLAQIEENKQRKMQQDKLKQYWDDFATQNGVVVAQLDAEMRAKQRELEKCMAEYNKSLAAEQNAYKEYLDRVVYTNKPTAAFFQQFNTSSR